MPATKRCARCFWLFGSRRHLQRRRVRSRWQGRIQRKSYVQCLNLPREMRNCTVQRCPALAAFIRGVRPPSVSCSSTAPAARRTSATSVWPCSQAYDSAVSPLAVVAWTFAPEIEPPSWKCSTVYGKPKPKAFPLFSATDIARRDDDAFPTQHSARHLAHAMPRVYWAPRFHVHSVAGYFAGNARASGLRMTLWFDQDVIASQFRLDDSNHNRSGGRSKEQPDYAVTREAKCSRHAAKQTDPPRSAPELLPCWRRNFTSSSCPSCAASIKGVEQPVSRSAPALTKSSAHSKNPPQQANVRAVSCVSSVLALTLASEQETKHVATMNLPSARKPRLFTRRTTEFRNALTIRRFLFVKSWGNCWAASAERFRTTKNLFLRRQTSALPI